MKIIGSNTTTTWTSATDADTVLKIDVSNYAGALITYTKTGTVSAGTIVFEFSDDDETTWRAIEATNVASFAAATSYTLTTASAAWIVNCPGATDFRVRLSVQISGAGSASLRIANLAVVTPFPGSSAGGGDASAANQTTIIGHVDGIEGLLTTLAGAVKNEDVASADGDPGFVVRAIRKATPANQSGTDGDYEPLQVSGGRLWTSATVTSGTITTVGECSDVRQAVASNLQGQVQGPETIDAPVATPPVSVGAYATADPTNQAVSDEGDFQYLKTSLDGRLWVTADSASPVNTLVGGTVTVTGTVAATQSGAWQTSGTIAHDSPTTAQPLMNGGFASAAAPTSVSADGDAVRQWMLRNGAAATVLTAAGALIGGDATNGLDVDITRMSHGKTVLSASGSASSSGNNTLVAAGTNRLKVSKFSLSTSSTTAMTCIFQSGAGGTELWRVILQAPTSVSTGANLAVPVPDWIFATASATLLNLNLSSANAVAWAVSYIDEA